MADLRVQSLPKGLDELSSQAWERITHNFCQTRFVLHNFRCPSADSIGTLPRSRYQDWGR